MRIAVFAWAMTACVRPLCAQPSEAADVPRELESASALSLSVGGGASLGAYEAGYVYYFVEALKRNARVSELRIATGTSAGSLNAFLGLVASCSPELRRPEDSLLYQAWTNTTLDDLHDPRSTPRMVMLSRRPMDAFMDRLREAWNEGLPTRCDVVLGVPVTRRRGFEVSLDGRAARMPRSEERFVVRIRGRGAGTPPSIENYQDVTNGFALALLPIDGDQPDEYEALRSLLYASGAFPFVFAPVSLPHCMANVGGSPARACTPENAVRADFVDGGFFENRPLRLAANIARAGLDGRSASGRAFRESPDIRIQELSSQVFFVELDPHMHAYPDEPVEQPDTNDFVQDATAFGSRLLEGMRSREIQTLLETYPDVRESVRSTLVYYPPISSLLADFFGFADRQLAEFDFVLGMHDARVQLDEELGPALARGTDVSVDAFAHPVLEGPGVARRFACMRAYLDEAGDADALCAGDELESFRAMLLVTMERLYSSCRAYRRNADELLPIRCRAAIGGESPPDLLATRGERDFHLPGEDDADLSREAIRRLAAYHFHFRDLGLDRDDGDRALVRLRERLGAVARDFVGRQSFNHQALDAVLRAALNSIQYAPPHVVGHVVVGSSIELGASVGSPYGRVPFLRATFALELGGLATIFDASDVVWRLAPSVGLEIEPTPWSSSRFQLRFGSRVGYAFSTSDRFGTRRCGPTSSDQALCSRMLVTAYTAVSLAELVRLQLTFSFFPRTAESQRFGWSVGPAIGIQWRSRR